MELIKLPVDARTSDFAQFVAADEVQSSVQQTLSGTAHIVAERGAYKVGDTLTVVRFARRTDPDFVGRRSNAPFVGWEKETRRVTIRGIGDVYTTVDGDVCNYYI